MAFPSTAQGWVAYVRNWIGADEYSDAQINQFLDLAQTRLNTDLYSYKMEKHFRFMVPEASKSSEPYGPAIDLSRDIPDFGKVRLVSVQGIGSLDVAALNEFVDKASDLTNTCYTPEMYTIDHGFLYIWPWPQVGGVVDIHYYEKVPLITAYPTGGLPLRDQNTFTLYHPDLLLFAASLEAAPYMVEDERIPVWEAKYATGVMTANSAVSKIKMGSTPLLRKISGFS